MDTDGGFRGGTSGGGGGGGDGDVGGNVVIRQLRSMA
jgi:hypothetical protein